MPIDIPGMPPRTVDVLLELRARVSEKAAAAKGRGGLQGPRSLKMSNAILVLKPSKADYKSGVYVIRAGSGQNGSALGLVCAKAQALGIEVFGCTSKLKFRTLRQKGHGKQCSGRGGSSNPGGRTRKFCGFASRRVETLRACLLWTRQTRGLNIFLHFVWDSLL